MYSPLRALLLVLLSPIALGGVFAQAEPNPATTPTPRPDQIYWHKTFTAQAKKGGIDLLFLGDSITQGWGTDGKAVWDKYYAPLKAANFGIGSERVEHLLWRVQNGNLDGIQPKVVVLLIGTNNIKRDTAPQVAEGVKAVIGEIRSRSPQTKILLLALFPRAETPTEWQRVKVAEINTHLAPLHDGRQVFFLDVGRAFLKPDGKLSKGIMHDFLHLTPTGYQIWADAMKDKLATLMK
jgi:lysophospholipase L1-like esterase